MGQHWCRGVAFGAAKYARNVVGWYPVLHNHDSLQKVVHEGEAHEHWAGVIGNFYEAHVDLVSRLRAMAIPVVNISSGPLSRAIPTVCNNEFETGQMAARYLHGEGHRRFAFAGIPGRYFSVKRREGLLGWLEANGISSVTEVAGGAYEGPTEAFLAALQKPCAVFAANDTRARHILWACLASQVQVPSEISVLGVDDDEVLCHMNPVAASSIAPDWETIGARAAAILEAIGKDESSYPDSYREEISPKGVSVRQSTDFLAVDDFLLSRALAVIKEEATHGLTVSKLARKLGVSTRTLERRFKNGLQSSVKIALLNARLDKANYLLATTRLPIGDISERTGFSLHSRFNAAFRKRFKCTPSSIRRGHGATGL
jgi:LacI family transcriptional regulator